MSAFQRQILGNFIATMAETGCGKNATVWAEKREEMSQTRGRQDKVTAFMGNACNKPQSGLRFACYKGSVKTKMRVL